MHYYINPRTTHTNTLKIDLHCLSTFFPCLLLLSLSPPTHPCKASNTFLLIIRVTFVLYFLVISLPFTKLPLLPLPLSSSSSPPPPTHQLEPLPPLTPLVILSYRVTLLSFSHSSLLPSNVLLVACDHPTDRTLSTPHRCNLLPAWWCLLQINLHPIELQFERSATLSVQISHEIKYLSLSLSLSHNSNKRQPLYHMKSSKINEDRYQVTCIRTRSNKMNLEQYYSCKVTPELFLAKQCHQVYTCLIETWPLVTLDHPHCDLYTDLHLAWTFCPPPSLPLFLFLLSLHFYLDEIKKRRNNCRWPWTSMYTHCYMSLTSQHSPLNTK